MSETRCLGRRKCLSVPSGGQCYAAAGVVPGEQCTAMYLGLESGGCLILFCSILGMVLPPPPGKEQKSVEVVETKDVNFCPVQKSEWVCMHGARQYEERVARQARL